MWTSDVCATTISGALPLGDGSVTAHCRQPAARAKARYTCSRAWNANAYNLLDTRRCCMRLSWLAVPVLAGSLILVACGDDDDSPEELNQAFCDELDAFGDSLADWTDLSVTSSVDDLREKRDATRDAFEQLRQSAADAREPEIDNLEQSWNELESAVEDFGDDASFRESLDNLLTAASAVGDDLGAVVSANQCSDDD